MNSKNKNNIKLRPNRLEYYHDQPIKLLTNITQWLFTDSAIIIRNNFMLLFCNCSFMEFISKTVKICKCDWICKKGLICAIINT